VSLFASGQQTVGPYLHIGLDWLTTRDIAGRGVKGERVKIAGRLIDGLGLKGERRGGAVVSPRHANFIVNEGGATAADVLELAERVRERVAREAGVELEWEVRVWRPKQQA